MAIEPANPLYVQWVAEWMEETRQSGSAMFKAYRKAHDSLLKCQTRYSHPSQAMELFGIGPTICRKLERKWEEHCKREGIPVRPTAYELEEIEVDISTQDTTTAKPKRVTKPRMYVPAYRSGAYAILLALHESLQHSEFMTKSDLVIQAAKHCDASFTDAEPGKFYTAWNSMKTLLTKEYVYKTGNPARYCLTDEGLQIAKRLLSVAEGKTTASSKALDFVTAGTSHEAEEEDDNVQEFRTEAIELQELAMPAGSFDIVLILDNREQRHRNDGGFIAQQLLSKGINVEVRPLELGDAIWIAKRRVENVTPQDEFVLNYILERKRMDDLVGSIKDGRFHEQKHRLKGTGLDVIYLIEETNLQSGVAFGWDAIQTVMSSTQVVDGFFLKRTATNDESIEYLANLTRMLSKQCSSQALQAIPSSMIQKDSYLASKGDKLITFASFSELFSKSRALILRDVYAKMLLTIRGLSAEKVDEIIRLYPTHSHLMRAFEEAEKEGPKVAKNLISDKVSGYGRKKIGPALSEKIRQVYRDERY